MSKKEQTSIKFIYVTKLDKETFTFTTKRLKVVKEYYRYVSLEDGSRIETGYIYDLYANEDNCRHVKYKLSIEEDVYSLKPISKEIKEEAKKVIIETLKADISSNKRWLAERETTIKELKDKIAEQEEKLAKLLKV